MASIQRVNDHGVRIRPGSDAERLRDVRVYAENGSVQLWVEVAIPRGFSAHILPPGKGPADGTIEALQYLTPRQAVGIGLGFLRSAWQAWRHRR